MTTDELLIKLPSHIGRNKFHGFYIPDNKRGGDIGWLYLHNDGKDWCASYGREGNFVCLNPDLEAIEDMPMDTKIRIWDDCEGQWGTPYGIEVREFDGIEFPKGQYIVITSY